ncbi:carboxyl-terminal protease [Flavobacteriaceae bacterium TP-CH-4]|uniref:Carboxyl-terminal protease n=1 Tax=Pelagihabitans pacificus TaxID=2696054 RepID=A0A967ASY7_9FLAO|nr:S41 family peptidase [Pelagihabitans pacificus]NHF59377.1 carboxyl-terminal protease [Pelagihabitans pacificus]
MKKFLVLFLASGLLFTSCNKDDDGDIPNPTNPNPDPAADVTVQDFMWSAMNIWYFWQENVPNLADDRFPNTTEGSEAYTEFLASEPDPAKFFDDKLTFSEDRFSFYSDDYEELTKAFAGVSKSNGLEFGLVRFFESDDLFGYVRYIVPGSDAATKDIQRGDIFTGVDGQTLTINNYIDLLFGDNDTYTLNMADIANDQISPNDREVTLTKQVDLAENPVFLDKIFDIGGQKIGYLVYNSFTNEYDEDLNAAFGRFVAGGVTDLVLDLRYNGGGSVNTARLLSSMIYGTNTSNLFLRQRWNPKIQAAFGDENLEDYFADQTSAGTPINTLNLSRVYILATLSSASASELVMNGLDPYMDVIHVGETTRGKNEFSLTFVDDPNREGAPFVYSPERESSINPDNRWAIQPLVGRNENADGFFDYTSGFTPDIPLEEDLANLGVLGDENEPLLARALQEITGASAKIDFTVEMPAKAFNDSKMFSPMKDRMILDKPLNINIDLKK